VSEAAQVIIPFRDRGTDPRRGANLEVVMAWWFSQGYEAKIVDDGLEGAAQFNRHRAYNRAVSRNPNAEVFIFAEADMLVPVQHIMTGVQQAINAPGLVVPFTQYRYLSDTTTEVIRDVYNDRGVAEIAKWWGKHWTDPGSVFNLSPEYTMDDGRSIGAVNILSRETIRLCGGFTEATHGNWYDDRIIEEGYAFLTGQPTRYVDGPAVHLYHLPGHKGDHLTWGDRLATQRNRNLLTMMRTYIGSGDHETVRRIMAARRP
jgi:hypothetical protein